MDKFFKLSCGLECLHPYLEPNAPMVADKGIISVPAKQEEVREEDRKLLAALSWENHGDLFTFKVN